MCMQLDNKQINNEKSITDYASIQRYTSDSSKGEDAGFDDVLEREALQEWRSAPTSIRYGTTKAAVSGL